MRTLLLAATAASSVVIGYFYAHGNPADPAALNAAPVPKPQTTTTPAKLVALVGHLHQLLRVRWLSGRLHPRNTDLPNFVYYPVDTVGKGGRFRQGGLVSMETPVVYFYTDREMKLSVKVDFPNGWITEWYPFAPERRKASARTDKGGQSIRWDVKLTPGEPERFLRQERGTHRTLLFASRYRRDAASNRSGNDQTRRRIPPLVLEPSRRQHCASAKSSCSIARSARSRSPVTVQAARRRQGSRGEQLRRQSDGAGSRNCARRQGGIQAAERTRKQRRLPKRCFPLPMPSPPISAHFW